MFVLLRFLFTFFRVFGGNSTRRRRRRRKLVVLWREVEIRNRKQQGKHKKNRRDQRKDKTQETKIIKQACRMSQHFDDSSKYGRNPCWIVKRYGKYGRKESWKVKRYVKFSRFFDFLSYCLRVFHVCSDIFTLSFQFYSRFSCPFTFLMTICSLC